MITWNWTFREYFKAKKKLEKKFWNWFQEIYKKGYGVWQLLMEGKISLGFITFAVRAHKDGRRKRIDNNNYLKWIDHNEKPTSWSYGNGRQSSDNVNVNEQLFNISKGVNKV